MEGKYIELENQVFEKIKRLSPNSRVLRKDLPITTKHALDKREQNDLDADMESFIKCIPRNEAKLKKAAAELDTENLPPVRSTAQTVKIAPTKTTESNPTSNVNRRFFFGFLESKHDF